jgi:hypothetical protein
MSTETTTTGGFNGDPAEAFNPPAASGCCGGTPTGTEAATAATSTCCGTAAAAQETNSCCAPEAKAEAVATGAGCCG